jgi:uncharacterized protein YbaR (Trm112 family)
MRATTLTARETGTSTPDRGLGIYACPSCRGDLTPVAAGLRCARCQLTYPLVDGIPNFILGDSAQSTNRLLRNVGRIDRLARFYESRATSRRRCLAPSSSSGQSGR